MRESLNRCIVESGKAKAKTVGAIMKKPIALIFVATILFALGVFLIASFPFALFKHDKEIAGGFPGLVFGGCCMIYVANGLLKLQSKSRISAIGVFGIFGLAFGWVFWMSVSQQADGDFIGYQMSSAFQAAISFFVMILSLSSIWILMRRGVRELFQHKINSPTPTI